MAGLRVETGGGFVEDEELGVGDEGPGNGQPALHATRERFDLVVGPVGQLGELEKILGPFADHLLGQVEIAAVDHQVVEDGEFEVEGVLLGDEADPAADPGPVGGRVHAEHPEGALRDGRHAGDHPHGRGLPGAVRTEEPVGLALGDLKVDPGDGHEALELLDQALGRDHRIAVTQGGGSRRSGSGIRHRAKLPVGCRPSGRFRIGRESPGRPVVVLRSGSGCSRRSGPHREGGR